MFEDLFWKFHRYLVDQLDVTYPLFKNRADIVFVSENEPIATNQIWPFFYFLSDSYSLIESPNRKYGDTFANVVCFQSWFDLNETEMKALAEDIKKRFPRAKLVYFDWFAPTDLRYAKILDPYVDLYVKKQLLKQRNNYNKEVLGDTNLSDYYLKKYGKSEKTTLFEVPANFFDKILVSPNFSYSSYILKLLYQESIPKTIDLHARITYNGSEWYSLMRNEARRAVDQIKGMVIASNGKVNRTEFLKELRSSKMCFSPFGYGEICWRDFEAFAAGSLLLKPDMSHIETWPDLFIPYKTYVPLSWDLSDFEEKCHHYLKNTSERNAIIENAKQLMKDTVGKIQFQKQMKPLFDLLANQN